MRKSAAQSTLDEYLNKKPDRDLLILKDSELGPAELFMIAYTRRELTFYHEEKLELCQRLPLPERPDLRAYHRGSAIFILSADTQHLIGGTYNGTIVIDEEFRGQGMATLIHILNDENDLGCLAPTHYSEGGYATRLSAHKTLCERAYERGEDVLPENLEAYGIGMPVALGM